MSGLFEMSSDSFTMNITSYMGYGYKNEPIQKIINKRTRDGTLYTYKFGQLYRRFSIPLAGVSSANATTINSWWGRQTAVAYTENSSVTPVLSAFRCRIINGAPPMTSYVDAQFGTGLFVGTIILETN